MNKTLKIIMSVFGLMVIGLGALIGFGMYTMDIEDMYGNNHDIFYNSRQGDFVVNHETKELGKISKTWTRFYIINNGDTLDISAWWDDKQIEILRLEKTTQSLDNLEYNDISRLEKEKKLELVKSLR